MRDILAIDTDQDIPKRRASDQSLVVGHSASTELHPNDYRFLGIDYAKDVHIVDIENIDPDVPKAQFSTKGSTCMDLYTREEVKVYGLGWTPDGVNTVHKIPLNVKIHPRNPNMYTKLCARSSTCLKYGILVANSEGHIDNDYNDEIALLVINFASKEVTIPKGTKIAQLEFCIKPSIVLEEMKIQTTDDHKGFGSTDKGKAL